MFARTAALQASKTNQPEADSRPFGFSAEGGPQAQGSGEPTFFDLLSSRASGVPPIATHSVFGAPATCGLFGSRPEGVPPPNPEFVAHLFGSTVDQPPPNREPNQAAPAHGASIFGHPSDLPQKNRNLNQGLSAFGAPAFGLPFGQPPPNRNPNQVPSVFGAPTSGRLFGNPPPKTDPVTPSQATRRSSFGRPSGGLAGNFSSPLLRDSDTAQTEAQSITQPEPQSQSPPTRGRPFYRINRRPGSLVVICPESGVDTASSPELQNIQNSQGPEVEGGMNDGTELDSDNSFKTAKDWSQSKENFYDSAESR